MFITLWYTWRRRRLYMGYGRAGSIMWYDTVLCRADGNSKTYLQIWMSVWILLYLRCSTIYFDEISLNVCLIYLGFYLEVTISIKYIRDWTKLRICLKLWPAEWLQNLGQKSNNHKYFANIYCILTLAEYLLYSDTSSVNRKFDRLHGRSLMDLYILKCYKRMDSIKLIINS